VFPHQGENFLLVGTELNHLSLCVWRHHSIKKGTLMESPVPVLKVS
jgi:hypothetical protein